MYYKLINFKRFRNDKDVRKKKRIVIIIVFYVLKWNNMIEFGIIVFIYEMLIKE